MTDSTQYDPVPVQVIATSISVDGVVDSDAVDGTSRQTGPHQGPSQLPASDNNVSIIATSANVSKILPILSFLIYLFDTLSSLVYAGVLISYANDDLVLQRNLNFSLWAAEILMLHIFTSIIVNAIATYERYDSMILLGLKDRWKIWLQCLIPDLYIWKALWSHIRVGLSGENTTSVVEWVAYIKLLQAFIGGVPQTTLQTWFLISDHMPKADDGFSSGEAIFSICATMTSVAFSYVFYMAHKYYAVDRGFPAPWDMGLLTLASFFILGGRSFSLAMVGYSYGFWVTVLTVCVLWAVTFIVWTIRVLKQGKGLFFSMSARAVVSIIETLAVATSRKWTAFMSLIYISFTCVYVAENHAATDDWIIWAVPFAAELLGLCIALTRWKVYSKSYMMLRLSALPSGGNPRGK
ncbi:unnamed protein product [Meganyctiphanes norvegica]|uniref:XK-related protein n=1 Tax=Meganyctiphanes norvegica TaxID=48144 RepID=A0AAV2QXF5_MEGNR